MTVVGEAPLPITTLLELPTYVEQRSDIEGHSLAYPYRSSEPCAVVQVAVFSSETTQQPVVALHPFSDDAQSSARPEEHGSGGADCPAARPTRNVTTRPWYCSTRPILLAVRNLALVQRNTFDAVKEIKIGDLTVAANRMPTSRSHLSVKILSGCAEVPAMAATLLLAIFIAAATVISSQSVPPLPCSSGAAELCSTGGCGMGAGGCCIVSDKTSSTCTTPQQTKLTYGYADAFPPMSLACLMYTGNASNLILGSGVTLTDLYAAACAVASDSGGWFAVSGGSSYCCGGAVIATINFTLSCL